MAGKLALEAYSIAEWSDVATFWTLTKVYIEGSCAHTWQAFSDNTREILATPQ